MMGETGDLKQRMTLVESLSARALRRAERDDLALYLTYEPVALDDVLQLMREEQNCCGFLDFELNYDAGGIYLRITTPEVARLATSALFSHFTPAIASPRAVGNTL